MRALPRSTRIFAIVFGSVTTSSFFNRYVVSIPAKGEVMVPSLPDLSRFALGTGRLRRIRIFLRLRIGPFVEPGDVGGEFVVEVGFEAHEGLLPALFPVDFGDAFKISALLARHTARIRRPIYDGVATQPLSPLPGSGLTA